VIISRLAAVSNVVTAGHAYNRPPVISVIVRRHARTNVKSAAPLRRTPVMVSWDGPDGFSPFSGRRSRAETFYGRLEPCTFTRVHTAARRPSVFARVFPTDRRVDFFDFPPSTVSIVLTRSA